MKFVNCNANLRRFHSMKCFDWESYLRHFHSMKCFDWEPYLRRFHSMKCFRLRAIFETFSFYEVLLIESHICSDANKFKPQNPGGYGTSLSQLKVSPCIIPWSAISVCIYLSLSILHLQILCDLLAPDQNQTQYQPPNCWRYFIWVVHKCLCFFTLITQTTSLESHAVISIFLTACYGLKTIPFCGPSYLNPGGHLLPSLVEAGQLRLHHLVIAGAAIHQVNSRVTHLIHLSGHLALIRMQRLERQKNSDD